MCRTLGLSSKPSPAVAALAAQLDQAYRRTSERLAANAAVELADGKVKLSALDRLEEPESLCSLRDRVAELLPRIDLPDVLAEVAAWTGFPEEYPCIAGRCQSRRPHHQRVRCLGGAGRQRRAGSSRPLRRARPDCGAAVMGGHNYLRADTLMAAKHPPGRLPRHAAPSATACTSSTGSPSRRPACGRRR